MQPQLFDDFDDAYAAVLGHVAAASQFTTAARGIPARECLNVSFTLRDPRRRLVHNPARRTNIVFCFAEVLWYLWGRDDLEMMRYYAPSMAAASPDGATLTGSAYGTRMFRPEADGCSQWDRVVRLLTGQADSKRAVIAVFHAAELAETVNPDVSCTIAVQYLLREGCLHAITYMRGNDAVIGLLSDVFSATLVQEFTAAHLGVRLGSYSHHVGSMHINDRNADLAAAVVAAHHHTRSSAPPCPMMPATTRSQLQTLEQVEASLRRNERPLDVEGLGELGIHPYWQQVMLLFEIYRQARHEPTGRVRPAVLAALAPVYRPLAANRWPQLIPLQATTPTAGW